MAVIPMGSFDQARVVPRTTPSRVDNSASELAGRAYERLGATMQGVAEAGLQAQQRKIEQQQAENEALNRAKVANAVADYELRVDAAATDHVNKLDSGLLDVGSAVPDWDAAVSQLPPPEAPKDLPADLAERFKGAVSQIQTRARLGIEGNVEKARRSAIQREASQAFDLNAKLAAMPGHTAEEGVARNNAQMASLRAAGFDEARAQDVIDRANEGIFTTEASARINAADGSLDALRAVHADLTAEDGRYLDKIDPAKRVALQASVQSKIDQLQQRQLVAADKIEARATSAIDAMSAQAVSGYPPKPEDMLAWQQAVQGSTQTEAFNAAIDQIQEVQTVLKLAPAQQEAYLADIQRKMQTEGASVKDQTRFKTLSGAIAQTQKRMRDEPLLYLQGVTGQAPTPLDFAAIAQGDMGALGATINDRIATLKAGRNHYGPQLAMRPLLPQEAQLFTSAMDSMPPEKLNGLFGSMRQAIGNDDGFNAVMQQIAPNAPLKARAGQLAIRGERGQKVSSLILTGEALLNPKDGSAKWKMPPDKGFKEAFDDTVGGAYQGRPQDYRRDLQAVRAVYAGAAARDGNSDASNEIDPRLLADSIRAVAGEPSTEFGRVPVLPPWGMSPDDFDDRAKPLFDKALQDAGYQDFSGIHLVGTPREGVYMLAQGITTLFDPNRKTRAGKPARLFIDLRAAPPPSAQRKLNEAKPEPGAAYRATVQGTR